MQVGTRLRGEKGACTQHHNMTTVSLAGLAPFPVEITAVMVRPGADVGVGTVLFAYRSNGSIEEYTSPVEGRVVLVSVAVHDSVRDSSELMRVEERCLHSVQYGGLCAVCGESVETQQNALATIAMAHDNVGLRISLDEATRLEQTSVLRLNAERKLILVVDLDQTIIHATVDPTVGEWQQDKANPNYPLVKEVRLFCLEEEQPVPQGYAGARPPPTKCWYYVKLRPGLQEFLERVAALYELHIYTMATRNYALAIAKIIDPHQTYFGDRILLRDESGLLTHKTLKRLFPVDQLMVVIIDDRGDVWLWDPNLVKVVPYDFFVGIGDINLSFLPKKSGQLVGPTKSRAILDIAKTDSDKTDTEAEKKDESDNGDKRDGTEEELAESDDDNTSPVDRILELGGGENNKALLQEQVETRSQLLEQQQKQRPLAKLQHELEQHKEIEENLLRDDDTELATLQIALTSIHREYYAAYDACASGGERPNLTHIIPQLKHKCLAGVVVLLSGILPLGMNSASADIVIWSRQFGVQIVEEVYPEVTHVVCRDPRVTKTGLTLKTRVARKTLKHVKVVNPDWLFACLSSWRKVDEQPYLVTLPARHWEVSDTDLQRYLAAVERGTGSVMADYDFGDASAEVDEFLADLSDDNYDLDDSQNVRKRPADEGPASKRLKTEEETDLDSLEQLLRNELQSDHDDP